MALGFLSRTIHRVQQKIETFRDAVAQRIMSSPATNAARSGDLTASIDKNTAKAVGTVSSIYRMVANGTVTGEVLRGLGNAAADEMKNQLRPITRTGEFRDSIKADVSSNHKVSVESSAVQADAIRGDNSGVPSAQDIETWMAEKPEFASLMGKERTRVAFAIMYSIKDKVNQNKTGRSDITRLPPAGERRYEYVKETVSAMQGQIKATGRVFSG